LFDPGELLRTQLRIRRQRLIDLFHIDGTMKCQGLTANQQQRRSHRQILETHGFILPIFFERGAAADTLPAVTNYLVPPRFPRKPEYS